MSDLALNTDDFDFEPHCREWMVKHEREWRDAGFAMSWIDTRPKWWPVISWSSPRMTAELDVVHSPLITLTTPCDRAWRFSLIGGGQIKIIEHWVKTNDPPPLDPVWNSHTDLVVAAHTDDRLRIYRGKLDNICTEMQAGAVLLRGTGEDVQAIADRAAATLRALTAEDEAANSVTPPDRDRFYALLDGARGCSICGRPLRDEVSKLVGVGPDCAHQWRIPHSRAAASKRLQLRTQILGETFNEQPRP
jgi:hypothetical protein